MTEYFIDLTDGTRLEIKLNFGTLYYLQKNRKFYKIAKRAERAEKKGMAIEETINESDSFEMAAAIIYAVLRSNGRAVTFDEALQLAPPDIESLKNLISGFQEEYEEYSKKKQAKRMMIPMQ